MLRAADLHGCKPVGQAEQKQVQRVSNNGFFGSPTTPLVYRDKESDTEFRVRVSRYCPLCRLNADTDIDKDSHLALVRLLLCMKDTGKGHR